MRIIALGQGVFNALDLVMRNQDDAHALLGAEHFQARQQVSPLLGCSHIALAKARRLNVLPIVLLAHIVLDHGLEPIQRVNEQRLKVMLAADQSLNGCVNLGQA